MDTYSSDDDLFQRLNRELVIQLTDDDHTGSVDQDIVDERRSTAHELANTFLRGQYSLPLDPPPKILTDVEADLLVFMLYQRRPGMEIPDSVKMARKSAMKILREVSRGKIQLAGQPDVSSGAVKTNKDAGDRMFSDRRFSEFL
jgi:phage gp36-like protein